MYQRSRGVGTSARQLRWVHTECVQHAFLHMSMMAIIETAPN